MCQGCRTTGQRSKGRAASFVIARTYRTYLAPENCRAIDQRQRAECFPQATRLESDQPCTTITAVLTRACAIVVFCNAMLPNVNTSHATGKWGRCASRKLRPESAGVTAVSGCYLRQPDDGFRREGQSQRGGRSADAWPLSLSWPDARRTVRTRDVSACRIRRTEYPGGTPEELLTSVGARTAICGVTRPLLPQDGASPKTFASKT